MRSLITFAAVGAGTVGVVWVVTNPGSGLIWHGPTWALGLGLAGLGLCLEFRRRHPRIHPIKSADRED